MAAACGGLRCDSGVGLKRRDVGVQRTLNKAAPTIAAKTTKTAVQAARRKALRMNLRTRNEGLGWGFAYFDSDDEGGCRYQDMGQVDEEVGGG